MGITGDWRQRRTRRYLLHALEIVERRALFRDTVDWPEVRAEAVAACAGAVAYADTHQTLKAVAKRAGGMHSGLRPPKPSGAWGGATMPSGEVVDGIGRLRLPSCGGGARTYRDTGHRLMRDLTAAGPHGWVVDLRGNQGGNMWPMLSVAGSLLPDGVLGYFVPPAGPDLEWRVRDGRVLLDNRRVRFGARTTARTIGPHRPDVPVAVLTDGQTGSSGEAVAVAFRGRPDVRTFGSETAGMTSSNETYQLRDGALLSVTASWFADHHHTVHRGPLQPDESGGTDPLAAAVDWIRRAR
ncbi:S41 family peptidase [Dactylosporangium siamense]|uniref:Peptidase S41 n=1 Tax=Dactylosporangium siamense TaxID=685454 RepID=A0A919PUX5_9ACTN|nr:S41 family peptidase [Dactylosporangium siamense]GIG48888.1 peptidase S41 [Dactylosporangium siamense]